MLFLFRVVLKRLVFIFISYISELNFEKEKNLNVNWTFPLCDYQESVHQDEQLVEQVLQSAEEEGAKWHEHQPNLGENGEKGCNVHEIWLFCLLPVVICLLVALRGSDHLVCRYLFSRAEALVAVLETCFMYIIIYSLSFFPLHFCHIVLLSLHRLFNISQTVYQIFGASTQVF